MKKSFSSQVFLTSGSLNSILSGSHYNRCWNIHAHFSEALERLLLEHFLVDQSYDIQQKITNSQISSAVDGMIGDLAANSDVKELQQSFERYKEEVRAGKHGKTAQFWLVNYLYIIHILNGIHIAVQESNYELRLKCWKEILPYFFCLNRTNNSRYGSYYVSQLLKIDKLFPGCKELLKYYGISVQEQDRYPLQRAVDQRGEQTLNRDAKTSVTNFAGNIDAVTKWTLNRSPQAEVTGVLKRIAGIEGTQDTYKQIRPHHIVNSNKMCDKLVTTISKDFTSPFSTQLSPDRLFNLTSGIPVDDAHAEEMLKIREIGKHI